jgi:hypothetical protein
MKTMKTLMTAAAAGLMFAGAAMAAEPLKLTDTQLDSVDAGFTTFGSFDFSAPFAGLPTTTVEGPDFTSEATGSSSFVFLPLTGGAFSGGPFGSSAFSLF